MRRARRAGTGKAMPFDAVASITQHQLRVFAAVAREGSFAKAARQLYMSEPTVSNHIKMLERLVGATLVERSRGRRQVELTEGGRAFLQTCTTVFRTLEDGVDAVRTLSEFERRTIIVGAGPHLGGYVLPRLIESFSQTHPSASVRVEVGRNQPLLEDLKRRKLDLAVLFGPIDDPEVVCEPFPAATLGLIGTPGHRLASGTQAPFQELANERLIVPETASPLRQALEQMAAREGVNLRIVMEAQDMYARIQAVTIGLGVALMYLTPIASQIATGELAELNVAGFPIRLERLVVRPRGELAQSASEFLAYMLERQGEIERKLTAATPA